MSARRAVTRAEESGRAQLFHALPSTGPGGALDAYQILLRLLHRNDWFTQEKACLLLTAVLASWPDKAALKAPSATSNGASTSAAGAAGVVVAAEEVAAAPASAAAAEVQKAAAAFVDWLCAQLRRPADPARSVPTAVHALSQLLREPPLRVMLHRAGGVQLVAPLVAMPAPSSGQQLNIQLLYEATLCCWELSFYRPAADVLCGSTNVVGALVDIVRLAQVRRCCCLHPVSRPHTPQPSAVLALGVDRHAAGALWNMEPCSCLATQLPCTRLAGAAPS